MIATQNTKLNVVPGGILPVVHVSQYDVDRVLSFTLYDGNGAASIESGTTVTIEGTKPDGNGFQYAGTLSGNVVTVNTTVQMTAVEGTNECKLTLKKGTQTIGSALFLMEVEKAGLNENTPISETDIPLIIAEATEQMERAEAAATAAALSETNAASSETVAVASAETAATDAASASVSATNANRDALKSEGHAVGTQNGEPVPIDSPYYHNNAAYWANYASQYAQGGLIYKGSILFANIPTSGMVAGDMYNIEEDFITDSRFQEGAGIKVKAGTNIAWNSSKWDLLATSASGHVVVNESGTEMPQRSKLQFEGCEVTDDSTNDITKIKAEGGEVISYADYQQLTPQQQANGDYFIPDYPDTPTGFDETPTVGSTNPVTSNGIATELNAIKTFIGVELESATKLVGDTSVTFTDSVIKTTSGIHLKSENASDTPIFRNPAITRSNGSVTFTFPPLTENTKFYLEVRNYEA